MTSLTRGPLPASVYWRRRLVVLSVALALVLGIARLLGGGSDASDPDRATPVAAEPSTTAPSVAATSPAAPATSATSATPAPGSTVVASPAAPGKGRQGKATATPEPVLAAPEGRCDSSDVAVTPEVTDAVAGRNVAVVLNLRTVVSAACTWRVSPGNVTVKITSGTDDIWSTRQCPRALPAEDVVVRNNVTTPVQITWNARRSDDECSRLTEWALPGYYHAAAASLGGEPSDVQFELGTPAAATVTKTVGPDGKKRPKRR